MRSGAFLGFMVRNLATLQGASWEMPWGPVAPWALG